MTRQEFKDRIDLMRQDWQLDFTCVALDRFFKDSPRDIWNTNARLDFEENYFPYDPLRSLTWYGELNRDMSFGHGVFSEILDSCRIILFEFWVLNTLDTKKYLEF